MCQGNVPEGTHVPGYGPAEAAPVMADFAQRWTSAIEALNKCALIAGCHSITLTVLPQSRRCGLDGYKAPAQRCAGVAARQGGFSAAALFQHMPGAASRDAETQQVGL